ncbi:MAG TPA: hypothetical protein VF485_12005 [Sphingomonas sp.]
MKTFLIAAGLMAAMFGGAPTAVAAPVSGYAPGIEAPQSRDDRRDNRDNRDGRVDRRDDRRGDRWDNGRRGDRWNNRRGDRGGWNNRRCHNERRHGRWVRVCGRNWR